MNLYQKINLFKKRLKQSVFFRFLYGSQISNHTVCVIVATRLSEQDFWSMSPLAKSLPRADFVSVEAEFSNTKGLPEVYNKYIKKNQNSDVYVFIHDDVWIKDDMFFEKIKFAISHQYDVIGIAGNTRISANQPAWLFKEIRDGNFIWDHGFLSGHVWHGSFDSFSISEYGPSPQQCELLDGVFLACSGDLIRSREIFFDEHFDFHFYDLDFCRTAAKKGLILGTWPIDLIHESAGAFGSPIWFNGYTQYLKKWFK